MKKILIMIFVLISIFWYWLSSQASYVDKELRFKNKEDKLEQRLPDRAVRIIEKASDSYMKKLEKLALTIWQKNQLNEKIVSRIDKKIQSVKKNLEWVKWTKNERKYKLVTDVLELFKIKIILEADYLDYYNGDYDDDCMWDDDDDDDDDCISKKPERQSNSNKTCKLKNIKDDVNKREIEDHVRNCKTYTKKWKVIEWLGWPSDPTIYVMSNGNIYGSDDELEKDSDTKNTCSYDGYNIPLLTKKSEKRLGFKIEDAKKIAKKSSTFNSIVAKPLIGMEEYTHNAKEMKLWWALVQGKNYVLAVKRLDDIDDDEDDIYYNVNGKLWEWVGEFEFEDDYAHKIHGSFVEESPWAFVNFNRKWNLVVARIKSAKLKWKEIIQTIQKCELPK